MSGVEDICLSFETSSLPNHLRCLLTDTVSGHLRVSTVQGRHNTAVDNSQVLDTIDEQVLVNNSIPVILLAHLTSSTRVVGCRRVLLDKRLPIFVSLVEMVSCSWWPGALDLVFGAGTFHDNLVGETNTFRHHEKISAIVKVLVVNIWVVKRVLAVELDLASGLQAAQEAAHGECVLARLREIGIPATLLVACR